MFPITRACLRQWGYAGIGWLLLWNAGCGGLTQAPTPDRPLPVSDRIAALWVQHQLRINTLVSWKMTARLALRTEQEATTVSVRWQQNQQHYRIRIAGIFGLGLTHIQGDADSMQIWTAKQLDPVTGNPEYVFEQKTGWRIPIPELRWWLLGVPAPVMRPAQNRPMHPEAHYRLNTHGRLALLLQQGWRIEYSEYSRLGGVALPSRIVVTNKQLKPELQVRLSISHWETED